MTAFWDIASGTRRRENLKSNKTKQGWNEIWHISSWPIEHIHLLGENINTIKSTEAVLDAGKEVGLEANTE
jgi:uncharacterized protein YjlB